MNTDRTVIIKNVGDCSVGLRDTQNRDYILAKGQVMRISAVSLQDILDFPGSRRIFKEGYVHILNISKKELYNMGLSEKEIDSYLEEAPEQKEEVVAPKEEEKIVEEIKEEIKEEVKEEIKKEIKKEVKTQPAKTKTTTKKSTAKKTK